MNAPLARSFKSFFVESRLISPVISVIVVVFRLLMFLRNGLPGYQVTDSGFVGSLFTPFFSLNPVASFLASTLCIFMIAFLLSELNVRYGILRVRTSLPFYMPLILFSIHPFFLIMTPHFPALIFLLFALYPLLASYQYHYSQRYAFQFSVLVAVAGIFQIYALLLLPLWLIGLASMGNINLRAVLASFFGVILVYWVVFVLYVFGDNIAGFVAPFVQLTEIYDFSQIPPFSIPQWGFIGLSMMFLFVFLIADGKRIKRERNFTKKMLGFSYAVVVASLLLQVLYSGETLFWVYPIWAYFSVVVAHFYTNTNQKWEIYSFFLLLAILFLYFCLNVFTDFSFFDNKLSFFFVYNEVAA